MRLILTFLLTLASLQAQSAASAPATTTTPTYPVSGFLLTGATPSNQVIGGVGLTVGVGSGQSIFGAITDQTGGTIAQNAQIMFGIKSEYPSITVRGYKIVPFSIVDYGAAIDTLSTLTVKPVSSLSLSTTTVTSLATSAGLAAQYAGGFEYTLSTGTVLGVGFAGNYTHGGWSGYPFFFVSKSLGKTK